MFFRRMSLVRKLTLTCLLFGVVPLMISGTICFQATQEIDKAATVLLENTAATIADKVDRNLFERYGDVQAFALNGTIDDRTSWYERDPEKNKIVQLMNQYIDSCDVYSHSVLVDTAGKLIAASSKDFNGTPINTAFLYDLDFSQEDWFLGCKNGNFHTKTKFTAAGNDKASNTYVEDVHYDKDCARIFPANAGMTMAFATPVTRNGKVIAYWNNHVRFELVEDIVKAEYQALKSQGMSGAEITIVNSKGQVVVDFDPRLSGNEEPNHDYEKVILHLNLAERGVEAVKNVIAGQRGNNYSLHARKQIIQGCGYAPMVGALGYPGLPWGVLVRVPEDEVRAEGTELARSAILWTAGLSAIITTLLGSWVGRRFAKPIREVTQAAERIEAGDLTQELTYRGGDEVGRLADVFRSLSGTLQGLNTEAQAVVHSAQAGDLQKRGQAEQFRGCYGELIRGMNAAVDAFATPTAESLKVLTQVADGDLRQRMNGRYQGEFERLATCVNDAVINLDDMISQVSDVGTKLGQVVDQAKSDSQRVAESATEQAATLEETAAALEEISSMVKQTADNSHQAKVLSEESRVLIDQGDAAMGQMSDAIQKIKASADEQARIVKTIDEIAFQTNLLALNAAVEAARAGDAGRGFAVVADEVRRLAQRSADAARTTASMIEESVKNAQSGVAIVSQVNAMLGEIKASGQKTNSLVTEIAAATQEQSLGIDQINTAVTELDKATQAVANGASSVANVATELGRESVNLGDLISRFNITKKAGDSVKVSAAALRTIERTTAELPSAKSKSLAAATPELATVGAADSLIPFDLENRDFGDF